MLNLSKVVFFIWLFFILTFLQVFGQTMPKIIELDNPFKPNNAKEEVESDSLKTNLSDLGYIEIPLEKMSTGHLVAIVAINERKNLRMVCDTGSSVTFITPKLVKQLGLKTFETNVRASGLGGGGFAVFETKLNKFVIGSHKRSNMQISIIDMSNLNQLFTTAYEKPVDGIIGSDWMTSHNALVDVADLRMFILEKK